MIPLRITRPDGASEPVETPPGVPVVDYGVHVFCDGAGRELEERIGTECTLDYGRLRIVSPVLILNIGPNGQMTGSASPVPVPSTAWFFIPGDTRAEAWEAWDAARDSALAEIRSQARKIWTPNG